MTEAFKPDKNWWPNPLKHLQDFNCNVHDKVTVAESFESADRKCNRLSYTALVSSSDVEHVLNYSKTIEVIVKSCPDDSIECQSKFYIPLGRDNVKKFEPLVVRWDSDRKAIFIIDNAFLAMYSLVPRITSITGQICWDDERNQVASVAENNLISEQYPDPIQNASVTIKREYLEDYATNRNCHLIQFYYEQGIGVPSDDDVSFLGDKNRVEYNFPGRTVQLAPYFRDKSLHMATVWGVRRLIRPGSLPVTEEKHRHIDLKWPGIAEPVTEHFWNGSRPPVEYLYINDSVLQSYEKRPEEYDVFPESGAVHYKNGWHISYCNRIGRDTIRIEGRKLYEGVPFAVIQHWNKYAIEKPNGSCHDLLNSPNVAKRSKRILNGLLKLDDTLSQIANSGNLNSSVSKSFVIIDRKIIIDGW